MVVVTGATGHIGNVLVRELLKKKEKVRVLIKPGSSEIPLEGLDTEKVYGDIRNIDDLRNAFQGAEKVFHLAAMISILPKNDPELESINVQGTKNVATVCLELSINKLIYTSSVHAISEYPHGYSITEDVPICSVKAIGKYGKSKAKATLLLLEMIKKDNLQAVIVQPSGVIGPYDYKPSQLGFVYNLMAKGLNIGMNGAYNFVDVRDVVNGIISASEKGKIGERYILSGHVLTIKEKKEVIDGILEKKHRYISFPKFLCYIGAFFLSPFYDLLNISPILTNESLDILYSNANLKYDKAKDDLGYTVRPFKETMTDFLDWLEKNKTIWKKTKHQI